MPPTLIKPTSARLRSNRNVDPIPFNRTSVEGNEEKYMIESLRSSHVSGDGPFTRKCVALLERELGTAMVLLTTSCTHALEMTALLLNIEPGDEVIVPSFTFVSTANAFVLRGARPIFADIRPDTLNLDDRQLEPLITPRTRAIVPVHYAGVGCEMKAILEIAGKYDVAVVEDNAHGLFARYEDKFLGTFGCMATQSFHETKNLTCGEGGALLINDPQYIQRAEIIREKGTNRTNFFRGLVAKYSWVDVGSSYLPSDILAACLFGQLEARYRIQDRRRQLWNYYDSNLRGWIGDHGVRLPVVPPNCEQSYHMYYLIIPTLDQRQRLIQHLKKRGISSAFHYLPLHLSKMGQELGGRVGACPVAEQAADRLLRLPFYSAMTEAEQERVITALMDFCWD